MPLAKSIAYHTSNLLLEGTFDSSIYWNISAGWLITDGSAYYLDVDNGAIRQQDSNLIEPMATNTGYRLEFDIDGTGYIQLMSYTLNAVYLDYDTYETGHHIVDFTTGAAVGTGGLSLYANAGPSAEFNIDNVTLKRYVPSKYLMTPGGKYIMTDKSLNDVIEDGHTVAWYIAESQYLTMTDSSISQWNDKYGSNHFIQTTGAKQPAFTDGRVEFDGVDDWMQAVIDPLDQPISIYFVFRQTDYARFERIFDATKAPGALTNSNAVGIGYRAYAGVYSTSNANVTMGEDGLITVVFNSTSSFLQGNNDSPFKGNLGTVSMDGITLGGYYNNTNWINEGIKEIIIRNAADIDSDMKPIKTYLNDKYSLW